MNNIGINRNLGTKWFTFYTKVRPWLGCVYTVNLIADFLQYTDVYMSNGWLLLYFLVGIAQIVLNIMVFVKSRENYDRFVQFVKGVLLFETIVGAYSAGVKLYVRNGAEMSADIGITMAIVFALSYLIWYNKNVSYFERRKSACIFHITDNVSKTNYVERNDVAEYENQGQGKLYSLVKEKSFPEEIMNTNNFCSNCGQQLPANSVFCNKCGTRVEEELEREYTLKRFTVYIFDMNTHQLRKEVRDIDIKKLPPSKLAENERYYAIEIIKDNEKKLIYCTKDVWDRKIEEGI